MTSPYRVALYAAPGFGADPDGAALRCAAERWLGRAVDGRAVEKAAPTSWTRAEVDRISVDARRYGFHGTLKAPFRLADGRSLHELDQALARFATTQPQVTLPRLELACLDDFLALAPHGDRSELDALAAELVSRFDGFRAPLNERELARRGTARLTLRQHELLERWGYPYVFDEFRFHLTLTDRLPNGDLARARDALADWFAGSLGRDIRLDALAVFVEDEPGEPFRLHAVHALGEAEGSTDRTDVKEQAR